MTTCTATTARGTACRAHPVRGTDRCINHTADPALIQRHRAGSRLGGFRKADALTTRPGRVKALRRLVEAAEAGKVSAKMATALTRAIRLIERHEEREEAKEARRKVKPALNVVVKPWAARMMAQASPEPDQATRPGDLPANPERSSEGLVSRVRLG